MIATGALAQGTDVIAQPDTSELIVDALVRILGFALLAGGTSSAAAVTYRWYSADEIPEGVAVLVGVSTVAVWLNTKSALGDAIIGETSLLDPTTAIYTVAAFAASAIAADGGRRLGDHLARDVFAVAAPRTIDDVTQLVRSAGRVVAVELPESIEDVDGYDPVDDRTRDDLAGQTILLPRRLSTEERRERLRTRLERDYGVGRVDVDFAEDGTIDYLGVGSKPAGIGPTLTPGSVAIAVLADPAPDASPGDAVDVWRADEDGVRRVTGAELRATAGDVATIAVDTPDADALETDHSYRLVTLPGTPDVGREFVSLLRAADETVAVVTVEADGSLDGATVDSLPLTVLALDRDGEAIALPDGDETLLNGDRACVLGRPEALRRLGGQNREGDRQRSDRPERDRRQERERGRGRVNEEIDESYRERANDRLDGSDRER